MKIIKITNSCHKMPCIEGIFDGETATIIRATIVNQNNPCYEHGYKAGAFLQGYEKCEKGVWVLVEFWNQEDRDSIEAFRATLEKQINDAH